MADGSDTRDRPASGGDLTLTNVGPVRPGDPDENFSLAPGFSAGQVLAGRYKVERFLARGGMGEVYQVYDEELGESVALKTILPKSANEPMTLDRFRREIQIARKVSHRNVCRIFDLGRHVQPSGEDVVFLTMELLKGVSLRARLREGVMAPDEAYDVVRQLAAGLGAAHRKGIVHRDLKPSNIFLVPEGDGTRAVIADFGLARLQIKDDSQLTVTGTGEILGTPAYMSPEQIEGKAATTASDVYSFGLVIYEMLTGASAFEGESAFQIALNKLRDAPTSPSTRVSGLPILWDRTILRCLEKEPSDRFADVEEIPAVLAGEQRIPRRHLRSLAKGPGFWVVAAMVLVIVGTLALTMIRGWPPWGVAADSAEPVILRQSVAVLGFENVKGDPNTAWISTALSDVLTTELASGGAVRTVPGESVTRARKELGIDRVMTLGPETLARLRELLATDFVVLGSYAVFGDGADAQIRLDSRIQDIVGDEIIVLDGINGTDFAEIAIGAAAQIRSHIGIDVIADSETSGAFPSDPAAAKLYAEGVSRLRSYDPHGAQQKLELAAERAPDSPLVWFELANAWEELGYDRRALDAAGRSKELSEGLGRELRLMIEGRYQSVGGQLKEAVDTYRSLWLVYPDNLEHGLQLAKAQIEAGMPEAGLETVAELKSLPAPLSDDPRIDLAEARAAGANGDANLQAMAAERVVDASRQIGSSFLEADGRLALGDALRESGQLDRSAIELNAALGLFEMFGDQTSQAGCALSLALTHLARGDIDSAIEQVEMSLEISRAAEAKKVEGDALNLLGSIRLHQGDFPAALEIFSAALEVQREIGNRSGEADGFNNLALVQMWSGDFVSAVDSFGQARELFRELGQSKQVATTVMNLGRIDAVRGDLDGARSLFEEAAGLFRVQNNIEALAEALFGLGEVLLTQGDLQGARARHEEASALRRDHELGSVAESEFALAGLVLSEAALGRRSYDDAVEELARAVSSMAQRNRPALEADALNYLAEAQIGAGMETEAVISLDRIRALEASANSVTRMVLRINEARLAGLEGRYSESESILRSVLADAGDESSFGVELEARLAQAEVLALAGEPDRARDRLAELRREAAARGWNLIADRAEFMERRISDQGDSRR